MKKLKARKSVSTPENDKNCFNCSNCLYIGEGDYMCEANNEIVISDWQPTKNFYTCKGKEFEKI